MNNQQRKDIFATVINGMGFNDILEELSTNLETGEEYLITIECECSFAPIIQCAHETKAEVVDYFKGGLHFWFDDDYGLESFLPVNSNDVISIEYLGQKKTKLMESEYEQLQ
ncbi:hypothetical protein MNB_SUP05-SYMBIONT-5-1086 [hydrothermal vent metagenome]|uniref:Uncharacterized protein n=1 Tax=hydrothermal vent metagenome TaxID=652676 RepID=A0A1W1E774_9ZZZZ